MHRLIDPSHTVEDGLITYKGLPAPVICDYLSREASRYAPGVEFHIGRIEMSPIWEPMWMRPSIAMPTVRTLPSCRWSGWPMSRPLRVPFARGHAIDRSAFAGRAVEGKAVLVHTGWSRHWRTDRYVDGHPFLTADGARHLRDAGAAIVGIDSLNIDDTADVSRPVHSDLLRHGIPIVEHSPTLTSCPSRAGGCLRYP
jgi:kynurenine formamidase